MHPNKKILFFISTIIILIVAIIGSYFAYQYIRIQNMDCGRGGVPCGDFEPIACTMDAMQCPDGSYVGRQGPRCEFAKCPSPKLTTFYTELVAVFEGTWKLPFGFMYDEKKIVVEKIKNKNEFIIEDAESQKTASVTFSYEGGRGLTVNDFWAEVGSKKCPSCKPNTTSLTFADTVGVKAYSSATDQYLVIEIRRGDPWIALVRYPIGNTNLETVVKTFAFPNTATNPSPIPENPESLTAPSKESSTPKPY